MDNNSNKTKFIKVTSRGMVTTSRGRVRTPLKKFKEKVSIILVMIARENATVVEVLPDGREIPLTINNFDKDNSAVVVDEPEKVVEKVKPVEDNHAQPPETARQLTRKERKKLEYEKKQQTNVKEEEFVVEPSTEVPQDAIEE